MEQELALLPLLYPPDTLTQLQYGASQLPKKPLMSIITGSGWGGTVPGRMVDTIPYSEIGIRFLPEVQGHAGVIRIMEYQGKTFLVFEGRLHFYQGYTYTEVIMPVTLSYLTQTEMLVLTNAAGSLHRSFFPGNLCLLTDQIDFTLVPDPRVFTQRARFTPNLRHRVLEGTRKRGIFLHQGVYVGVLGPSFETPSEIRLFSLLGGHVIGMSTVKEAKAAANFNIPLLGVSLITNWGSGLSLSPLSHEEVLEISERSRPLMHAFFETLLTEVPKEWTSP